MPSNRCHRAAILQATLVSAFLLFDTMMPVAIARLPNVLAVLMFANGVVIAQTWLWALWAALGSAPWGRRVVISLALSVMSVGLFEGGLIYITTWGFAGGIREVFLAPLELMSLACPLLVLRGWRGWQVVSDSSVAVVGPQRFSLRQLFLATTLVAAAISLAQLGVAELPTLDLQRGMLVGSCLGSLISSVLAVIPLTWLCLAVRFARAVAWLASLAIAANVAAGAWMCRYWIGRELQEGLAGLAFLDAISLTFAVTLLLLRRLGRFTLISGRSAQGSAVHRTLHGEKPPGLQG